MASTISPNKPTPITIGKQPIGHDGEQIGKAKIKGDTLTVPVTYGGGCTKHDFQLNWGGAFLETRPVRAPVQLSHNGHNDGCEAIVPQNLEFDLTPMKEAYQDAFRTDHGTIELSLDLGGTYKF